MQKFINHIIGRQLPVYFISPHLDDAAFSAGGLISYLADKTSVTVITAFTRAGKEKHSLSGLAYARKCGFKNTEMSAFFSLRRQEDRELWNATGVKCIHLPFIDALWRPKPRLNLIEKFTTLFLNDFRYLYPTHRLHVSRGRIHSQDLPNLKKLASHLRKIIQPGSIVFCPLGLGHHVDHVIVREVCTVNARQHEKLASTLIYWEDAPYNLYHNLDSLEQDFIVSHQLKKFIFNQHQSQRKAMYPAYKTQFGKLFNGQTDFHLKPEFYYVSF